MIALMFSTLRFPFQIARIPLVFWRLCPQANKTLDQVPHKLQPLSSGGQPALAKEFTRDFNARTSLAGSGMLCWLSHYLRNQKSDSFQNRWRNLNREMGQPALCCHWSLEAPWPRQVANLLATRPAYHPLCRYPC